MLRPGRRYTIRWPAGSVREMHGRKYACSDYDFVGKRDMCAISGPDDWTPLVVCWPVGVGVVAVRRRRLDVVVRRSGISCSRERREQSQMRRVGRDVTLRESLRSGRRKSARNSAGAVKMQGVDEHKSDNHWCRICCDCVNPRKCFQYTNLKAVDS